MNNDDLTHEEFKFVLDITYLAVKLGQPGAEAALKALEAAYKVDDDKVTKI